MSIVDLICRLVARIYFTFVHIICWIVGVVLRKRNVSKPENSLLLMSAKQAADRIRKREIKSIDLIEAYIARIEQVNGITNSVVENNFDEARQNAREVDTILDSIDEKGEAFNELMNAKPLLGVPFTVKDCIEVKGMHCTAGLVNRRDMVASEDADVVARTVGGSSGGEAALVAAAGSVIGLGSDIGGSIRIPSYFNGVFGLKPSSGVVSLVGHVIETTGHPEKMLRIGPICRYAEDLPIILKVIVSDDKLESLQLNKSTDLKTLRVFYMNGISNCFVEPLGSECSNALKLAVEHFERKYDICAIRVDLPLVHNALDFYFTSMNVPGEPAMVHEMSGIKVII
ncbi:unnamed protein product [Anisakis simplex]|uniref:Fatty-acid amide hydrolase 2 (inferred by orthology to a human protein) n=1 Tax=Anisakis simplex TaxID=6269 RepID=A0A0M3J1A0_ANISI|nr:unnamed protein product [Anisakis simplex]